MAQAVQPRTGSPAPTTPAPSRPKAKRKVPFLVDFYRSALGKKYVIAVTGIVRKNDLQGPGGISLGGGRVRIGGGAPVSNGGSSTQAPPSANAIIDGEVFRPLGEPCPR